MKIYFIRHAQTRHNLNNKWQGGIGSNLGISKKGKEELEILKKKLRFVPDVVFTSPLRRAVQTANHLYLDKSKIIIDDLLIERNFGKLEGTEVSEEDKEKISNFDLNTDLDLGIETIQEMYFNRVKPFIEQIKNNYYYDNKKIVIVSHSWVGRLIAFYASNERNKNIIKKSPRHAFLYEFSI